MFLTLGITRYSVYTPVGLQKIPPYPSIQACLENASAVWKNTLT